MLAKIFISPFVDQGNARRYTWDAATFNAIKDTDNDAPLGVKDFVQTNPDRPFLIVGGTMIYQHPAYDYPRDPPRTPVNGASGAEFVGTARDR
jgi:hypothetical protein